jgi:hypothetical protein
MADFGQAEVGSVIGNTPRETSGMSDAYSGGPDASGDEALGGYCHAV